MRTIPLYGSLTIICLLSTSLLAQGQRGSIGGTITDSTRGILPGATLTITNDETGSVFKATSLENGTFLAAQLLPGKYTVVAEVPGFKQLKIEHIQVNVDQAVSLNLQLQVGELSETVKVESETALINTETSAVGHVVQNRQIVELPLNGRNVFDLVNLTPASFRSQGGLVSIAGGRTQTASAMLDGVFNSRGGIAAEGIEMNPPIDSMQEFKVQANNMSAEFGRATGGLVNATTKTGTNEFHGVLYEFLRNEVLDSKGWDVDEKASLKRNQFGGTFGGPIVKNKSFFFYNYDGFRERRGVVRTRRVPTERERAGDFSQTTFESSAGVSGGILPIYDPQTGLQFPGNVIPSSRQDSVSLNVLKYVPLPNRVPNNPITGAGNWQQNSVNRTDRDFHIIRLDHDFTANTKIFGRYILTEPDDSPDGATPGFGLADPDAINIFNRRQNLSINFQQIITPRMVSTFTFGGGRVTLFRRSLGFGEEIPDLLGLNGVEQDAFPRFNFGAGRVPMTNIGTVGNQNRAASITNSQFTETLTWVTGKHSLKFGGEYWGFNANEVNRNQASGQFTFAATPTQGRNAQGQLIANSGLPLATFLLGMIDSVNVRVDRGIGKRSHYTAGFIHDDWKIHTRLTLNFGLRYELESPASEVANRQNNFDPHTPHPLAGMTVDGQAIPAGTRGVVTFPGRNGYGKYLVNWDRNNFAPRFGFAWRPFGHNETVVRAGYGIYFGSPYNREIIQQLRLGFGGVATVRTPVPFTLQQGLPAGALEFPAEADLVPEFGAIGTRWPQQQVQFLDPNRRTNYTQNFNLTIAHQLKDIALEFGYLGNLGRKVPFPNINLNHIPPELLPQTSIPTRLRRPYPQFPGDTAQIQILSPNWGVSNYHAFTFKSERRFSQGIGWIFTYTLSKWIDNVVATGGDDATFGDDDQIQNIYNISSERSLSTNDVRHRVVMSPIIDLPFGRGRRWVQNGIANQVLGGWSLSSIVTLQSGSPFGVQVNNGPRDILGDQADGKNLRPDLIGNPELPDSLKGKPATGGVRGIQWFDPESFAVPARFTHGNAPRTVMTGPGYVNFDIAVLKNFSLAERHRLQFRWEMFNAFNTPSFGVPGSTLGAGGFGISGAGASDREMQFALKYMF
jgi:Carboxypeptidase regulatory-like domain